MSQFLQNFQASNTSLKMPEVERADYIMYEMVLEEAKRSKKPRPASACSLLNLDDIQRKLQVRIFAQVLDHKLQTFNLLFVLSLCIVSHPLGIIII